MNPLHGQRQPSPGGNLYSYGNPQDDFSTPFNDPNSSFSDPNTLFNQNFNTTFQSDFQPSSDNVAVNDSTFQNALNNHGQYAPFLSTGSESQSWQNNPYLDSNPYAFNPSVSQPSAFNAAYAPGRMSNFANDMNMNFSFNGRDYGTTPAAPSASTISPSVINQGQQTIPPSALQANDDMWQDSRTASVTTEQKAAAAREGKTPTPTPQQSAVSQPPQPPPPAAATATATATAPSSAPSKPLHNHDELQAGVPPSTLMNGFHERSVADYRGKAEAETLKGWIHVTKNVFETNESRLASLPEAPVRSSISQLRVKLAQSDAARLQPAAKAKLEDKLRRREKKDKSKKKKDKLSLPKTPIAAKISAAAAPGQRSSAEGSDSEDSSDSSEEDSGSDYDGDSDRDDEPFPLPKQKPTNPVDAIKYEVTEAVWAPSSRRLNPDILKSRFKTWLEHIQRARRDWKSGSSVTQKAEKKQLLEDLVRITAKQGHPNFVESIDQLTPLANLIAASVTELVKAERYDDSLIEAFILLFLKISIIKWSFLLQSRLNKLLPRIVKNTKGNLKAAAELLVGKINKSEAASREPEKKQGEISSSAVQVEGASELGLASATLKDKMIESRKSVPTGADAKKSATAIAADVRKPPVTISDAKKPLLSSVQKKVTAPTNGKTATIGSSAKVQSTTPSISGEGSVSKPTAVTSAATSKEKEKTRYVVTKPPSIFSSISASKKPSATSAAAAAAKTPAKEPKPAVKQDAKPEPKQEPKPAAPRAPVFSFAETLASIGKPKDEEKVKKDSVDRRPPETDEERKKRLRKESRRHLRVTWPTEDKLCQIKLFDHGLEDEIAHEAAEIADLKNEGRALKREYRQQHSKMDDFEQDFIKESDDVLDPESTDFSSIDASQKTTNVEVRAGGGKPVESPESTEQKKREQGVMIAVYATDSDIPFSPKEPPADSTWNTKEQYDFGDPPLWIRNRSAAEMERMNMNKNNAPKAPTNVSDVLKNLSQFSQIQNPQPTPQQSFSNSYDPSAAINLFMSMQGSQQSPAPASAPPAPAAPVPTVQQSSGATDLSSILSNLAALNQQAPPHTQQQDQQQQQQQQQSAPMAPQQSAQSSSMPSVDPDILAFLSQYNSSGTQNPPPPPLPPPQQQQQQQQQQQPVQPAQGQQQWGQPSAFNLLNLLGQQQSGGQQQQQGGAALASLYGGQWPQQQQQQQQDLGGGKNNKRGYDDDGTNGTAKRKKGYQGVPVVPCKYWKSGKCHYGDNCTFKHD